MESRLNTVAFNSRPSWPASVLLPEKESPHIKIGVVRVVSLSAYWRGDALEPSAEPPTYGHAAEVASTHAG